MCKSYSYKSQSVFACLALLSNHCEPQLLLFSDPRYLKQGLEWGSDAARQFGVGIKDGPLLSRALGCLFSLAAFSVVALWGDPTITNRLFFFICTGSSPVKGSVWTWVGRSCTAQLIGGFVSQLTYTSGQKSMHYSELHWTRVWNCNKNLQNHQFLQLMLRNRLLQSVKQNSGM